MKGREVGRAPVDVRASALQPAGMRRRRVLRWGVGLGALALGRAASSATLQWATRVLAGFGTTLSLRAGHPEREVVEAALDAAVEHLQALHAACNLHDPASAIARLNREGRLASAPAVLRSVLASAQDVARRSNGDFDATVQPLWDCYAAAAAHGRLPGDDAREAARARIGWRHLQDDSSGLRLSGGAALTLNGIAQGAALDGVRAVLRRHGVAHALIDSGEWACLGRNPQGDPWTLGIADPRGGAHGLLATLALDGRCVATSADDQLRFSADGRFHHLFDPHRGISPTGYRSVTVLAEQGVMADALTKVVFVGGPSRLMSIARDWDIDVVALAADGRVLMTPRLRQRLG